MEGEELPEPKRPPFKCGKFIGKYSRAEKTVKFFNEARKSLSDLLKLLENSQDEHGDIPALLKTYSNIEVEYQKICNLKKNFPLIVLEGLDGSGKSTVGMRLVKNLNAERVPTPPNTLSSLREKFDGHYCCHSPFYYFGNYVAAIEVAKILQEKPVIMDRFWHSTTAFALAQMKEDYIDVMKNLELPAKGSDVYQWPEDLIKPDIVIFLDVSEDVRNERLSRRRTKTEQEKLLTSKNAFRQSVLQAYENMENPGIQKVNGNADFKQVLQEINDKIKHLF